MTRFRAELCGMLCVVALQACADEKPAEPARELTPEQLELTGGEYVDPRLFPEGPAPAPTCPIQWGRCELVTGGKNCCYGPCTDVKNVEDYCIGCLPPGMPCIQHEQCCGYCSKECSLRDETCSGICLLGEKGHFCHYDSGCLSGKCVEAVCR